jgi:transcriptional regulator with XRE-family HTH domain
MPIRKRITGGRETFGSRVRSLRTKRELTQSALAREVGVSATCIWNWEEDNTHPRPASLRDLAAALGTTAVYLQSGEGEEARVGEVAAGSNSLVSTIQTARETVAAAAGLEVAQVRIVLDYGG